VAGSGAEGHPRVDLLSAYDYDIAIVSDLRYPGGNSTSLVEEVKALAVAGYSTALVHLPAEHMKRRRSFNHKIIHSLSAGMATLEPATRRLKVRGLVVRQPRIFANPLKLTPRIESDERVLVVNHPPFDGRFPMDNPYYRVDEVQERIDATFGPTAWAPLGPQVRKAIEQTGVPVQLRPDDWYNIINTDEWHAEHARFEHDVPVIGRHSRPHPSKWPTDPRELLAAYPDDDRFAVRILGGAEPAIAALGRTPRNWTIHPFGAMPPVAFLLGIDFFVYFHHPGWTEAFGRNTIEAMASGVPAILPPQFSSLFGEAAVYGSPYDVQEIVSALFADRAACEERVRCGRDFVEERFGANVHVRRIESMIGAPDPGLPRRPALPRTPPRRERVLLIAAETTGLSSVIRIRRLARALSPDVEPVAVVGVPAVSHVARAGLLCEYVQFDRPGHRGRHEWVVRRLSGIIERERPEAVWVDAARIPAAVENVATQSGVPFVALVSRAGLLQATERDAFARVVESDDVFRRLDPATPEAPDDGSLRAALFLPTADGHRFAREGAAALRALVALGGDACTVASGAIASVVSGLRRLGVEPVVAKPVIGSAREEEWSDVASLELDPLGGDLAAFDFAVISPSGMLVQDAVALRLPFISGVAGTAGSHADRAEALARWGIAPRLDLCDGEPAGVLAPFVDDELRRAVADRLATIELRDGTGTAAGILANELRRSARASAGLAVGA